MAYIEDSHSVSNREAFRYYSGKPKRKVEASELSQVTMFLVEALQLNG
jgi:hypothetical protein